MKQKQLKLFETEDVIKLRRKQTQQYDEFTAKFDLSHKKTTDDCYTPPEVYNCVKDYFLEQFPDWKDRPIVRPFCPGGDFERFDYPDNCVVIDNPPFSIFAKIVRWYIDHDIQFALFAPHLTCVVRDTDITYYIASAKITYENGAFVCTSFVTNHESDYRVVDACELSRRIAEAQGKIHGRKCVLSHSKNIITPGLAGKFLGSGALNIRKDECVYTDKEGNRTLFGIGFLISDRKAEELAEARSKAVRTDGPDVIEIPLNMKQRAIVERLNKKAR